MSKHVIKPSQLDIPSFVMNFPFTVDNKVINNVLMEDYQNTTYDYDKVFKQYMTLYRELSKEALVYLLPSKGDFQDQVYVANLGIYLPHVDTIVLSNYKSEPRIGEEEVGREFFEAMKYKVAKPPTTIEGEADFKYIRDNLYIGGYGIRTDINTHSWIIGEFGARVISVEMKYSELYHFDCMFLPLNAHKALAVTSAFRPEQLKLIEQEIEVVSIPESQMYDAYTNSVVLGKKVFYTPGKPEMANSFCKLIESLGYEPVVLDLSEFEKSGAGLSCMVMHLNFNNRIN